MTTTKRTKKIVEPIIPLTEPTKALPPITKPRLNYKLIAYATGIVILFPIIISTILIGDKVQTGKIPAYNITTPATVSYTHLPSPRD